MQFLDGLEGNINEGNIYIANNTPPYVVKLYQELFQNDLLLFLKLRYEELVVGGQMLLIFLGRKNEDAYNGDLNHVYGLLAQSIQFLVEQVNDVKSNLLPVTNHNSFTSKFCILLRNCITIGSRGEGKA
jgi:hypothetical protein